MTRCTARRRPRHAPRSDRMAALRAKVAELDDGLRAQSAAVTILSRHLPQAGDEPQAAASPRHLRLVTPQPAGTSAPDRALVPAARLRNGRRP